MSSAIEPQEEWRDFAIGKVPFGKYQASSLGNVRNAATGRVLKANICRRKQRRIFGLSAGPDGSHSYLAAVLVAAAFHGPRPPGLHTAHLDGNRQNDRPENLAYVTPKENCHHKWAHGTMVWGEKHSSAKLTREQVEFIRSDTILSDSEKARRFGVAISVVGNIRKGRIWRNLPGQLQDEPDPTWLKRSQVAQALGVAENTVWRWEKGGYSPVTPKKLMPTGAVYYEPKDLEVLRAWAAGEEPDLELRNLADLRTTVALMYAEYQSDDGCDYRKINALIECAAAFASGENAGSARECLALALKFPDPQESP